MRGRFVVLEGIDGCGKTTQLQALADWLPRSGLMPPHATLVVTREPGGTPLGRSLRQLLLHPPEGAAPGERAELLLYAADRAQHVEACIAPALARGDWVLSDRFSGSTAAYQGHGRGLDQGLIDQLEKMATAGVRPDLCCWLALDPAVAARRRAGQQQDRIEAEGLRFLQRVHDGFAELARQPGWHRLEADQSREQIQQQLQDLLQLHWGHE
jgi:dTMP kinase